MIDKYLNIIQEGFHISWDYKCKIDKPNVMMQKLKKLYPKAFVIDDDGVIHVVLDKTRMWPNIFSWAYYNKPNEAGSDFSMGGAGGTVSTIYTFLLLGCKRIDLYSGLNPKKGPIRQDEDYNSKKVLKEIMPIFKKMGHKVDKKVLTQALKIIFK